jgi:hypothetical protein
MKKTLKYSNIDQNQFFTNFENVDLTADHLTLEFNPPLTEQSTLRIFKFVYNAFDYLRFGASDNYTMNFWK